MTRAIYHAIDGNSINFLLPLMRLNVKSVASFGHEKWFVGCVSYMIIYKRYTFYELMDFVGKSDMKPYKCLTMFDLIPLCIAETQGRAWYIDIDEKIVRFDVFLLIPSKIMLYFACIGHHHGSTMRRFRIFIEAYVKKIVNV